MAKTKIQNNRHKRHQSGARLVDPLDPNGLPLLQVFPAVICKNTGGGMDLHTCGVKEFTLHVTSFTASAKKTVLQLYTYMQYQTAALFSQLILILFEQETAPATQLLNWEHMRYYKVIWQHDEHNYNKQSHGNMNSLSKAEIINNLSKVTNSTILVTTANEKYRIQP